MWPSVWRGPHRAPIRSPGLDAPFDRRQVASVTVVLHVRTLTAAEHLGFLATRDSASFLQTPAWGQAKREWRSESIGWVDDQGQVVGAGLALYRQLPRVPRSLAYLPEGPVIDWTDPDLGRWLHPLAEHLGKHGAFGVRMGPPVVTRRWYGSTIKDAIASGAVTRLRDLDADEIDPAGISVVNNLQELGWRPPNEAGGFAAGQPRYVFQLPLAGRDEAAVLKSMNQLWRRNIKRAEKAGVKVTRGGLDDLEEFHQLYAETAQRDSFTPRPLHYFLTMFRALSAESPERIRLYRAHHDGDLVAATIAIQVGRHVWYSYGASSTAKRDVRGSNAIQWQMIRDALASGAATYDLRGITDTLDADDPHFGLIQFKLGTGGHAVEYVGEWDLPLSKMLYKAFDMYMRRRG